MGDEFENLPEPAMVYDILPTASATTTKNVNLLDSEDNKNEQASISKRTTSDLNQDSFIGNTTSGFLQNATLVRDPTNKSNVPIIENTDELTEQATDAILKEVEIPTPITAANITPNDYAAVIQQNEKSCLDLDLDKASQMFETQASVLAQLSKA